MNTSLLGRFRKLKRALKNSPPPPKVTQAQRDSAVETDAIITESRARMNTYTDAQRADLEKRASENVKKGSKEK